MSHYRIKRRQQKEKRQRAQFERAWWPGFLRSVTPSSWGDPDGFKTVNEIRASRGMPVIQSITAIRNGYLVKMADHRTGAALAPMLTNMDGLHGVFAAQPEKEP